MRLRLVVIAFAIAALLAQAAPAAAAEPYRAVKGGRPGRRPAKYDKVFVQRFGPPKAKRVLVLVPGFLGGAGDFRLIARDIVKRVPGLQVWALDRRSQAFEDTSVFRRPATRPSALDYYLGFKYKRSAAGRAVRGALGAEAGAGGPAPGGAQGARGRSAQGDPRRPLAGRVDHRGLRAVGLQRPARLPDLAGMVLIDGGLLGSFD